MEFKDVIKNRHSVRTFADKPVERDVIDTIIDIALTAPSSRNCKSSAFLVIEDKDTIAALSEMRETGSAFMSGAAAAIVVAGDSAKTDLWSENCSISATFIQLAATDLGLGSCWVHVAGRPRSKTDASKGDAESYVRQLLGIRDEMRVLCVMALGYPAED